MKSLQRIALFLPILILLTACPYESTVPISEASTPIDKMLLGKWYKDGEAETEFPSEYYKIDPLGSELYEVTKFDMNSQDSTYRNETYISHISTLKDKEGKKYVFLNMKKDGKYYLHKIDLSENQFVLYEVTDNIDEKFNTTDEMKAFVQKHMHLSFFYNKDETTYYKGDHEK